MICARQTPFSPSGLHAAVRAEVDDELEKEEAEEEEEEEEEDGEDEEE